MESISFQYPTWYLLGCVLVGLLFAGFLYYRSGKFTDAPSWLRWVLAGLRFLTGALLVILLLSPLLKSSDQEIRKPVIVFAQDASESVGTVLDSLQRQALQSEWEQLAAQLDDTYDVVSLAFGSEVRSGSDFSFPDKSSNLSEALQYIYDGYSTQNLGAVIMTSDGIYNQGSNPLYQATRLGAPVFTVPLGDTIPKKDLLLKRVFNNQIAYLGDRFSIQIDISAVNAAGAGSELVVSKIENGNARVLQRKGFQIGQNDYFNTEEIILDADKAGVQRYRISLQAIQGESTTANNSRDIFLDVLDARQKILLIASAPHPDLAAIRSALLENLNYEVETAYVGKTGGLNLSSYNFVVIHQLPGAADLGSDIIQQLDANKTARLYVVGSKTNTNFLNQKQSLLKIISDGVNTNEVQATIDPAFSLFTISDHLREQLPSFPPILAPFGEYQEGPAGQTFLNQRIGRVETAYPLLTFGEADGIKTGILSGEGIWKWRLFDFLQNRNHAAFNELVQKSIQYLSVKEDKRRFRIRPAKNIFDENEVVQLDAELYNESFQRINTPDVSLAITDEAGRQFNYTFDKTADAYTIQAGALPVGNYTYSGRAVLDGENLTASGQFSVQPVQLELYQTTADHGLLRLLSQEMGGQTVYPGQLSTIATAIRGQETVKPVIYESTRTRPLIDLKWIFFLLLLFLSAEWFLRRYFGSY
ncbi:MAG: hypothetical protein KDC34_13320 [Saprospiraceae bacterium]|nr:hypothetical protein [Saprospiraceae bacterium]